MVWCGALCCVMLTPDPMRRDKKKICSSGVPSSLLLRAPKLIVVLVSFEVDQRLQTIGCKVFTTSIISAASVSVFAPLLYGFLL